MTVAYHDQGDKVKPAERIANPVVTPSTGLFALLSSLLRVQGSGTSRRPRGAMVAVVLAVLATVGALAFMVAPAFAAAPEAPEVLAPVAPVAARTAVLRGVLNPGKEGEPGAFELDTYEFVYRESKTECKGAGEVASPQGLSLGAGKEGVAQGIEGLTPGTDYTVCLVAHNEADTETAVSGPLTFTTAITPETPTSLEAKPVAASTATLNGVLNPGNAGNPGSYEFLYQQSASECQGANQKATPATPALGGREEAALAPVKELLPHTMYTFCLRARNEAGEEATSAPVTFTTLVAAPKVEESSITDVASTSATLSATLNPEGAETTYMFEYAPAGGTFAPVLEAEGKGGVPAGTTGVPLSVHVQQGLSANTAYEFRLVAHNSVETVAGEPASFTTEPAGGALALPDNRQWEMVTPPAKHGALFYGLGGVFNTYVIQASVNGDAIIDQASGPSEAESQGVANTIQVLSTRGPDGWSSQSLGVPQTGAAGPAVESGQEYHFFSEDLSLGVLLPFGNFTPLSPYASEATPYIHTDYLNGNVTDHCESSYLSASSCYRPILVGCPDAPAECKPSIREHANVPAGTEFGVERDGHCTEQAQPACGAELLDATPDLSHLVLSSCAALTANATGGCGGNTPLENNYEWSEGQLQALPGGLAEGASENNGLAPPEAHALSVNGQRVLLESGGHKQLLLRENSTMPQSPITPSGECEDPTDACSIQIDATQGGSGSSGGGTFQTSSSDDSRIFFTDESRLTSDSTAASGEPDLYEYDLDKPVGERLTDLSVGAGGPADVMAKEVLGASEDGSYVYFTAAGAIAGTGAGATVCSESFYGAGYERQDGEEPANCNVYVSHNGVTKLVAAAGPLYESTQVSPNGRWLEFMSDKDLTGYDTRDAASGRLDLEVYLYDSGTGRLVCASCNPTGARPSGIETGEGGGADFTLEGIDAAEPVGAGGSWLAAGVPGWHGGSFLRTVMHEVRYLSDSGRLFFDSTEALVPQDINGKMDVYEYEPSGVGSCTSASATFGAGSGGCVSLISSGTSSANSAFLDSSKGGGDVFFITTAKLAPHDYDTSYDVYDAHECTAQSPCPPAVVQLPPPCDTEASCKAAPTPQPEIYGAPASATFSGTGNLVSQSLAVVKMTTEKAIKCRRGFAKSGKGKCVRKPKPKKHAKRSTHGKGSK